LKSSNQTLKSSNAPKGAFLFSCAVFLVAFRKTKERTMLAAREEGFGRLISEKEAARLLSLSVKTLQNDRMVRRGLPYHKIGRAVRYSLSDVEQYVSDRRITHEAS
jgi:excisionase family DNA binding protein